MKFCDGCGQELKAASCGFCGKESSSILESSIETPTRGSRFRWLRSDRPKRYLAEMMLVAAVLLVSTFLVLPNFQTNQNAPTETEAAVGGEESEPGSSEDQISDTSSTADSDSDSDWNYNELVQCFDGDGNPCQGQYSFSQWLETWEFSFETPRVERNSNCRNSTCVQETLRITFAPLSDFNLYSIKGVIRNTSGQRLTPTQLSFEIVEGDKDFVFEFSNESFLDLREYPGNIFFKFEFFQFDAEYSVRPENRILDLT